MVWWVEMANSLVQVGRQRELALGWPHARWRLLTPGIASTLPHHVGCSSIPRLHLKTEDEQWCWGAVPCRRVLLSTPTALATTTHLSHLQAGEEGFQRPGYLPFPAGHGPNSGLILLSFVRHWRWRSPQEGMMGLESSRSAGVGLCSCAVSTFHVLAGSWPLSPSGVLHSVFLLCVSLPRVSGCLWSRV